MTRQFSSIWFWFSALALAILAVFLLYPLLNVLTGSIGLIVVAYVVRYMATALNAFEAGLETVGRNLDAVERYLQQTR